MNRDFIQLAGIKNPKRVEAYFASHLVDIAYAEPLSAGKVKILVERATDLRKEDDVNWILGLIVDALRKSDEDEFSAEIVLTT